MSETATILNTIAAYKRDEVEASKEERSLQSLEADARARGGTRGFHAALLKGAQQGYGLIAEIKKASPSKGLIREDFDPAELAVAYETGGAACLSVLTDGPSFQGDKSFLSAASAACSLPVLRKDFMLDPYQVVEARAIGADAILIILAMVDDACAAELENTAKQWGMDVLIEVHDPDELDRATRMSSPLIGINNRNLHTFETELDTTRQLVRRVPEDRLVVSESGLHTPEDLADLARYGVRAFLVGESLMRQPNVAEATRQLLNRPLTGMAMR